MPARPLALTGPPARTCSDELIDVIEGNRVYMPCVYALNKIDAITMEELDILDSIPHYCPISSHYKWNLDGLMDKVFEYLAMTRVYTKPKGQMPDYSAPVILRGVAEPCAFPLEHWARALTYSPTPPRHTSELRRPSNGRRHELARARVLDSRFVRERPHGPRP
jgi:hypothetical protein